MITFLYIGIVIAFFVIVLFLSRRPLRLTYIIASVFLIFLALPMLIKLAVVGPLHIIVPAIVLSTVKSYPFIYGPLLYLYTKFEIDPKQGFHKLYLVHFIPFILVLILPLKFPELKTAQPGKIMEGRPVIEKRLEDFAPPPHVAERSGMPPVGLMPPPVTHDHIPFPEPPKLNMKIYFIFVCMIISFVMYTVLILTLLQRHRKYISEYYSYDSIKLNLRWLQWITVCFATAYSFVFITAQINPKIFYYPLLDPRISPDIALSFFIFAFSFFALQQPAAIGNDDKTEMKDYSEKDRTKKYEKSGLKKDEADRYCAVLEKFMKDEKPYLDPDFTISDLSNKLAIRRHHLTQVINETLNKNFFMYINEYRVLEAKLMMDDKNHEDYTILRIAYESGFNSKSSFNTMFKRLTGYTPTEYKKKKFHMSSL